MMGIKRPPPVQTTVSGDMGYSKEAAKTINPPVEPVLSVNTTNQAELHKEMTQKHQVELSAPPPAAPISAAPTIPAPTTLSPSTPTQNTGATPTRKSSTAATRERKLSTASNMSSKSIDEKHEELTKEEDDEAEMATNVVKVMENSATKWAVALRVAKIFIDHPENIKVKVSKKTITIRSQIEKDAKISYLKREVQIPSDVNQKTLGVEALRDELSLVLRCNKF